ncbi:MAG: hypothetical protein HKN82_05685 [Akkermansiaceae bacterium]|nr:hypothetical protein [Akkermansiaceae bacterium]
MRSRVVVTGLVVVAVAWGLVAVAQMIFGNYRVTAESVQGTIAEADFVDWSDADVVPGLGEREEREEAIREIADQINKLDFAEREKGRENRLGEDFFRKLSARERTLFVDLTIVESMNQWFQALDGLPPEDLKKFVERGMKEIEKGTTAEDMERMREMGDDLVARATQEGFRAYLEKTSAETKMELAPLMEAMNEVMQGLRNPDWE